MKNYIPATDMDAPRFHDFSSARALIRWAREDIQQLELESEFFLSGESYEIIEEPEPVSGDTLIKARMAPVPDQLCKLASHALWDLKHALDHATFAAVQAIRGREAAEVYFPICSHPNDLEARLRSTPKGQSQLRYPTELHDVFRKLEPYPTSDQYVGGGDEFIAISRLANSTKHAIALRTGARTSVAGARGVGGIVRIFTDSWDSSLNELTLCAVRPTAKLDMRIQLAAFICFSNQELLEAFPASQVLSGFASCVEDAVHALEAAVAAKDPKS